MVKCWKIFGVGNESSARQLNPWLCESISKDKTKEVLKKMANGKTKGPDQIPVELWKCLWRRIKMANRANCYYF